MIFLKSIFIYCSLLTVNCSLLFAQCGVDRWDIKTLSDADTTLINFNNLIKTTVSEQVKLPKPEKFNKKTIRLSEETTVYNMDCWVVGFKRETDMSIHIVIKDMNTSETMVAEFPSPYCPEVKATSHFREYIKLNDFFLKNIGKPVEQYHKLLKPIAVNITGVGMFDFVHGQKGIPANGREIYPLLKMNLLKK